MTTDALAPTSDRAACRSMLIAFNGRIRELEQQMFRERRTSEDTAIVLIAVDSSPAALRLAEQLAPAPAAWAAMRLHGQVPVVRGLVERSHVHALLRDVAGDAAVSLSLSTGTAVVVANGAVFVFTTRELSE